MKVNHVNTHNFQQEVIQSTQKVLLDFWAPWCGPCRSLSPVLDQVAQLRPDVRVCKVNVDECPELAKQFRIMSIPTMLLMENGQITGKLVGAMPAEQILSAL